MDRGCLECTVKSNSLSGLVQVRYVTMNMSRFTDHLTEIEVKSDLTNLSRIRSKSM